MTQDLDPGIAPAVAFLQAHGYVTTDSGDGVSKGDDPDALPFPHVVSVVSPSDVVGASIRAMRLPWHTLALGAPTTIEATYSPLDGVATLLVAWGRM